MSRRTPHRPRPDLRIGAVWMAEFHGFGGLERTFLQRMVEQPGVDAYKRMHTHAGPQVFVVTRGDAIVDCPGPPARRWELQRGDVLAIGAEVPHRWLETGDEGVDVLAVNGWGTPVSPEILALTASFQTGRIHRALANGNLEIERKIETLNREGLASNPGRRTALAALTLALLVELSRAVRTDSKDADAGHWPAQYVSRAIAFMAHRLDKPLTLEQVARAAGVSASHLVRLFRRQTRGSPMRALTQLRVQAAQNLLVTTDLTAGQIAGRVGLTSVHYLSRVFSQHTGESPRVYRKRMLEQALE